MRCRCDGVPLSLSGVPVRKNVAPRSGRLTSSDRRQLARPRINVGRGCETKRTTRGRHHVLSFDDYIGGGSADGDGQGHCCPIRGAVRHDCHGHGVGARFLAIAGRSRRTLVGVRTADPPDRTSVRRPGRLPWSPYRNRAGQGTKGMGLVSRHQKIDRRADAQTGRGGSHCNREAAGTDGGSLLTPAW